MSKRFVAYFLLGAGLGIIVSAMTGCGGGVRSVSKVPVHPSPGASGTIFVQLNDDWNVVFPSDDYTLTEAHGFVPPNQIYIMQGNARCWDGMQFNDCVGGEKNLRARLKVGSAVCEYLTSDLFASTIPLVGCNGLNIGPNQLSSGTLIELENYDAPGQLLEVQFTLSP